MEEIKVVKEKDYEHGFKIIKFQLFLDQNKIGSLDIALMTETNWMIKYPNIWEFMFWVQNWQCWSHSRDDFSYLTEEQIEEVARLRNGTCIGKSKVEKMEESIWATYGDIYEEYKISYVNKPHVEYVWVNSEFRNKGYAKKLYFYAVDWLKEKYGLPLYSGINQTRDGECLWESFERHCPERLSVEGNRKILK